MKPPVLVALLFSALLFGCVTQSANQNVPSWALNPTDKYPASRYLTAVGQGDTLRAAEASAFNRLAGRFKTKIQATETLDGSTAESFGSNSSFEQTSDYQSAIKLQTSETLLNVETLEQHQDNLGRTTVLIALNRSETARLYEDKISSNSDRIVSLQGGETYKLKAYAKARQALILGLANQELIDQLAIIQPASTGLTSLPYKLEQLRLRAAQATSAIHFSITMPGNSSALFKDRLAEVMTQRGFTQSSVADLRITGNVAITSGGLLRKDISTVRYQLLLNVKDALGTTIITLQKEGRESHLTAEDARRRAEQTVTGLISKELNQRMNDLLDTLIGQ